VDVTKAATGMPADRVREVLDQLLDRYKARIPNPPAGKTCPECCDLRRRRPTDEYAFDTNQCGIEPATGVFFKALALCMGDHIEDGGGEALMELVKDRTTGERATEEAEAVMYAALSRGLSFKLTMGNILMLTPALTITREEMDRALDIIEACLSEVEQGA
jgi:hypothetical protein